MSRKKDICKKLQIDFEENEEMFQKYMRNLRRGHSHLVPILIEKMMWEEFEIVNRQQDYFHKFFKPA